MILGYCVKTTDGWYVAESRAGKRVNYYATSERPELIARADAYRRAAEWIDSGYLPTIVKVTRK